MDKVDVQVRQIEISDEEGQSVSSGSDTMEQKVLLKTVIEEEHEPEQYLKILEHLSDLGVVSRCSSARLSYQDEIMTFKRMSKIPTTKSISVHEISRLKNKFEREEEDFINLQK